MAYINFSVADKAHRLTNLVTDLGGSSYCIVYAGAMPQSPDNTVSSSNLLCALPCSATAGVVTYAVQNCAIVNAGTGGTNGVQTVTGTTGTGTKFQASVLVVGGVISSVLGVTLGGTYTALPSNLNAEPVTGGGLSSATLSLAMTGVLTFSAITTTNATATGTASLVRFATANTAGAAGIIDMDAGGTGGTQSVQLNTLSIVSGTPVVIASVVVTEA